MRNSTHNKNAIRTSHIDNFFSITRKHSSSYYTPEEESDNEKKVSDFIYMISSKLYMIWEFIYMRLIRHMKNALYHPAKQTSEMGNECERMTPKPLMMVSGTILTALSAGIISSYAVPKAIIDDMPLLVVVQSVPIFIWAIAFIIGIWMFASRPMIGRGHGILSHNILISSDDGRNALLLSFDDAQKKLARKYQALQGSLRRIFHMMPMTRIRSSLWSSECIAIEDAVRALSYGHIDMSEFSYFAKGHRHNKSGMKKDEFDVMLSSYDSAIEDFNAIMKLWQSTLGIGNHVEFVMYEFSRHSNSEMLEEICEIGRALGVDQSIEAYMDGVPLEDIIA